METRQTRNIYATLLCVGCWREVGVWGPPKRLAEMTCHKCGRAFEQISGEPLPAPKGKKVATTPAA